MKYKFIITFYMSFLLLPMFILGIQANSSNPEFWIKILWGWCILGTLLIIRMVIEERYGEGR